MNFAQLAKERYSVRKFQDKKVEPEKIESILEVGRIAPTAVNHQPQRIIVLDEQKQLDKIKECTPFHFDAPLAIIICYDSATSWRREYDDFETGYIDASIVATHMMLQIAELGLGTTWVGHFDPVALTKLFQLPENIIPVAIFPTGYPSNESKPSHFHEKYLDKEKTICYNTVNFSK